MIKLSKLTDYAVVVLAHMAQNSTAPQTSLQAPLNATSLSAATHVPEPTVAKIMKALAKANIVASHRGVAGGYELAHAAHNITVRHIIEAIDGPIALTACTNHTGIGKRHMADMVAACPISCSCTTKHHWQRVTQTIINALDAISLADMASTHSQPIYDIKKKA